MDRAREARSPITIQEREWTDEFGTHYEVRAVRKGDGRIFCQTIKHSPVLGWSSERGRAYDNVLRAVLSRSDADE